MFNLFDISRAAGGGAAVDAMARQFGITPEQTERAMRALLPALAMGLQGSAREPDAFAQALGLMGSGRYAPFFDNPALAFSQSAVAQGNEALAALFGSKDVSRRVAREAAAFAGIGPEIIKQMLPVLAAILLGGLQRSGQSQPRRREETGGFFEQILDALRGGATGRSEPDRTGRGERERERPDPYRRDRPTFPESRPERERTGGGWGDILADILRTPFPAPADRPADREAGPRPGSFEDAMSRRIDPGGDARRPAPDEGRRERWPRADAEGTPPHGDAFETWGRMFKAGQDVQEQYVANLRTILETVWGGAPRR